MKIFLTLILCCGHLFASVSGSPSDDSLINHPRLELTKQDQVIAEHIVNTHKFVEKGYLNQDVLNKVISETERSKHFSIFLPWLREIQAISRISSTSNFILHCSQYSEKKQTLYLERKLERAAGDYCRERALEAIGRDIEKTKSLSEESNLFIQQNLKFYLTKKNKKNFAFFIQAQTARPEILRKISQEVTAYSVRHEIVPSHEVLKDLVINEQITKLIQDKGFNPLQHQNVFYAEFGKLIEQGYKIIDPKPQEDVVKNHTQFLKNFLDLNQDHLPVGICLSRLNDFAKAVFRSGYRELSREIFKFVLKKNNREIQEDAQFFYLWTHLYFNEFKEAHNIASRLGLLKNPTQLLDSRLKFWIGVIQEELGQISNAVSIYENVVLSHPLSYYAIMASKKLQAVKSDSPAVPFYIKNSSANLSSSFLSIKDLDEDYISSLVRLRSWSRIDSAKFLKYELKRLNGHSMPVLVVKNPVEKQLNLKSDLHLLNAKIIQRSENYLSTFRYLYEVLDKKEVNFNRQLLEVLYPRPYLEHLFKALKGDAIDPIVVLALIRQESVFNPYARSRVGARGLMQLMPKTAKRYKGSVNDSHLVNPEINIDLGTKYIKTLMKRYEGNLVYVLAAYNAGESRVDRWREVYFDSNETILKNIESIPFLETRNYVKLIFRNIFFYKLLIEKKNTVVDPREVNKLFDVHLGFNK
jgi:soluble lytic murein transglycosylase